MTKRKSKFSLPWQLWTAIIIVSVCLIGMIWCGVALYKNEVVYEVREQVLDEINIVANYNTCNALQMMNSFDNYSYGDMLHDVFLTRHQLRVKLEKAVGLR